MDLYVRIVYVKQFVRTNSCQTKIVGGIYNLVPAWANPREVLGIASAKSIEFPELSGIIKESGHSEFHRMTSRNSKDFQEFPYNHQRISEIIEFPGFPWNPVFPWFLSISYILPRVDRISRSIICGHLAANNLSFDPQRTWKFSSELWIALIGAEMIWIHLTSSFPSHRTW